MLRAGCRHGEVRADDKPLGVGLRITRIELHELAMPDFEQHRRAFRINYAEICPRPPAVQVGLDEQTLSNSAALAQFCKANFMNRPLPRPTRLPRGRSRESELTRQSPWSFMPIQMASGWPESITAVIRYFPSSAKTLDDISARIGIAVLPENGPAVVRGHSRNNGDRASLRAGELRAS